MGARQPPVPPPFPASCTSAKSKRTWQATMAGAFAAIGRLIGGATVPSIRGAEFRFRSGEKSRRQQFHARPFFRQNVGVLRRARANFKAQSVPQGVICRGIAPAIEHIKSWRRVAVRNGSHLPVGGGGGGGGGGGAYNSWTFLTVANELGAVRRCLHRGRYRQSIGAVSLLVVLTARCQAPCFAPASVESNHGDSGRRDGQERRVERRRGRRRSAISVQNGSRPQPALEDGSRKEENGKREEERETGESETASGGKESAEECVTCEVTMTTCGVPLTVVEDSSSEGETVKGARTTNEPEPAGVDNSQAHEDDVNATADNGVHMVNWTRNLQRKGGGFWSDARWYDLQLTRRMPLAEPMLKQLVYALPPLPKGSRVCDLAGGSGRASHAILSAYPEVKIVLLDASGERVAMAHSAVPQIEAVQAKLAVNEVLPEGPYDAIIGVFALHVLVGHDAGPQSEEEVRSRYTHLFCSLLQSLNPGGLLMVGDHCGAMALYEQMKIMDSTGFIDIDCAWRQDDMFVYGGRKAPLSSTPA